MLEWLAVLQRGPTLSEEDDDDVVCVCLCVFAQKTNTPVSPLPLLAYAPATCSGTKAASARGSMLAQLPRSVQAQQGDTITGCRCLLANPPQSLTHTGTQADRYPPMTRTFFPDGSFDLEWVDTSLRMVDLRTEEPRYKHVRSFTNKTNNRVAAAANEASAAAAAAVSPEPRQCGADAKLQPR